MHRVSRRQAVVAVLSTFFFGQLHRSVDAAPAVLSIRMDQWLEVQISLGRETLTFTGAELFAILRSSK